MRFFKNRKFRKSKNSKIKKFKNRKISKIEKFQKSKIFENRKFYFFTNTFCSSRELWGHSFDVEKSILSIYMVFRPFGALLPPPVYLFDGITVSALTMQNG